MASYDEFTLSVGLAHQLEHAFRRNYWTTADVHRLCRDNTLDLVKEFVDRILSTKMLQQHGHLLVDDVFTVKLCCGELNSYESVLTRLLNALHTGIGDNPIMTLGELVFYSEIDLLRVPNLGDTSVELAKKVLARYGLYLGMKTVEGMPMEDFVRAINNKLDEPLPEPPKPLIRERMIEAIDELEKRNYGHTRNVLRLHFGIEDGKEHTLEEIGNKYHVTRERVRQIEERGRRILRHVLHLPQVPNKTFVREVLQRTA